MVMETIRGSRFIPVYVSLLTAAIFLCSVKECQGSYFGTTQKSTSISSVKQYIFAEQYGRAMCSLKDEFSCDKLDDSHRWTIHGLWPTSDRRGEPISCKPNEHFRYQDIADLLPRLKKEWTNLRKKKNAHYFWKHEWTKHGTCYPGAGQDVGSMQHEYFNIALTLFENGLDFDSILKNAYIVPSSNPYTVHQIVSAFGGAEFVSELKCEKRLTIQRTKDGHGIASLQAKVTSRLVEIRICLRKDNFMPARCNFRKGGLLYGSCGRGDPSEVNVLYY